MLVLVAGIFAALPLTANAVPTPVAGQPAWDNKYTAVAEGNQRTGEYYDRGDASGDKISSNAHSGDYPGVYFRWDDKQKLPGVFLVEDWVFDLFEKETFYLTAKNSNSYYKYEISRETGTLQDGGVYVYGIPKEVMAKDNKGNAKPDELKNINMVFIDGTYKSAWILLTKTWYDEEGYLKWNIRENVALDKELQFSNGLKLGINEDDFSEIKITDFVTAKNGKTVSITETKMPAGYEFKDAHILYGEGSKISGGVSLLLKPNDKAAVHFENKKQWAYIEIAKNWQDKDGNKMDQPNDRTAEFNIDNVYTNVGIGTYNVKEGTYEITENDIADFTLVNVVGLDENGKVTVAAGKTVTVTFTNEQTISTGAFSLKKFVTDDGELKGIVEWLSENNYDSNLRSSDYIRFELYHSDIDGNQYDLAAIGTLGDDNMITFDSEVESGWYLLHETMMGRALEIFEQPEDLRFYFFASEEYVVGHSSTFDYDSLYTIVNGYGNYIMNLNYGEKNELLNNNGDVFPIAIKHVTTGAEYVSFCANGGSQQFAGYLDDCDGYMVPKSFATLERTVGAPYAQFVSALNYIYDTYGDLSANRPVTQTVIWALLGAIDVTSDAYANINPDLDKEAVSLALYAAETGYVGNAKIVDLVYLICENDEHNFVFCQPQLVPVFNGAVSFVNKPQERFLPYEFDITVYHRAIEDGKYLVYPDVGETFNSHEEAYIEWLNNVEGFTFLNLYLAAIRTNDPADMASVEGYICSFVEKNDLSDNSFDLTQNGNGEDVTALIIPNGEGHYEITFWYTAKDKPLTVEEQEYLKYRAYVQLWNDFYHGGRDGATEDVIGDAGVRASLYNNGGIDHYNALLAFYAADILPPYFAFQDFTDYVAAESVWVNSLEIGLIDALTFLGYEPSDALNYLTDIVVAFGDTIPVDFWN
jgi:hypothetical protein